MNTNFKNLIVASGFAGCAVILVTIVSLGTTQVNRTQTSDIDLLAKVKIEKTTNASATQQFIK